MNLCLPVTQNLGLKSPVSAHFGSAPLFLVVDTATGTCREIPNRNEHHAHGMCQPLESLAGERFDGIVVGGIGQGALGKLRATGVRVFRANAATVEDAVAALLSGVLEEVTPASACAGHAREHENHVHPSDLPTR
jgi:predicted Fe-Mo cluster-binding NifX family protein